MLTMVHPRVQAASTRLVYLNVLAPTERNRRIFSNQKIWYKTLKPAEQLLFTAER